MYKKIFLLLVILLLTGCEKDFSYENVPHYFQNTESYSGNYKYQLDFGGVFEYCCTYSQNKDGSTLEIYEPAELSGIIATCAKDEIYLEYEDVVFKTYLPESQDFSPVSSLNLLIEDLKNTTPTFYSCDDVISVTFENDDYIKKAVLSKEDFKILSCEFFYKNNMILNITLQ